MIVSRKHLALLLVLSLGLLSGCSSSEEDEQEGKRLDQVAAPIESCGLDDVRKALKGISLVSWSKGVSICESASRSFGHNPSISVFRYLAKASGLIAVHGPGSETENAYQILNTMEAAGLRDDASIRMGIDSVWRIYSGSGQRVTPRDLNVYLRNSQRFAKPMRQDDLLTAGAIVQELKKARGE